MRSDYYPKNQLNTPLGKKVPDGRGRKKIYEPETLLAPLKQVWFATDQMCGKRLKAAIPIWLPFYELTYGALNNHIQTQLLAMSEATIDRLLLPTRNQFPKRLCGTKPGSLLKKQILLKFQGVTLLLSARKLRRCRHVYFS